MLSFIDRKVKFLAKETLFWGPLGWLMNRWGGVKVSRTEQRGLVDAAVGAFERSDEMILVIAPEGTRLRTNVWKSGFLCIAEEADVPVVISFIDAESRTTGFGPLARVDGDIEGWMATASQLYAEKKGLRPENSGVVAL